MSGDNHNQADREIERDEFLIDALPALFGSCVRASGTSWCGFHDAHWSSLLDRCEYIRAMDDYGDRLIEAWEGRIRGEVSS